jgi:P-loop Domain of unknown function (DUF2791)
MAPRCGECGKSVKVGGRTKLSFDGPQGVQRLEPLAQRQHVDFQTDARFDNPRAVQLRLSPFDHSRLLEVGVKVRDLFGTDCSASERIRSRADAVYMEALARSVAGKLGGKVGIAPRFFLKKLVADVLDRIDQFDDFNPIRHYQLTVTAGELTTVERSRCGDDPAGIRTPVPALKGLCPRPLDDRATPAASPRTHHS